MMPPSIACALCAFLSTLSLRRATDTSSLMQCQTKFLSTLSLRRATCTSYSRKNPLRNFYPRSPCGERPLWVVLVRRFHDFYPRSPCGERRVHYDNYNLHCVISIHALLAESDFPVDVLAVSALPISIHALLAESDPHIRSTSCGHPDISIHALLAESDNIHIHTCQYFFNFYPRSPCGERHNKPTQRAG